MVIDGDISYRIKKVGDHSIPAINSPGAKEDGSFLVLKYNLSAPSRPSIFYHRGREERLKEAGSEISNFLYSVRNVSIDHHIQESSC